MKAPWVKGDGKHIDSRGIARLTGHRSSFARALRHGQCERPGARAGAAGAGFRCRVSAQLTRRVVQHVDRGEVDRQPAELLHQRLGLWQGRVVQRPVVQALRTVGELIQNQVRLGLARWSAWSGSGGWRSDGWRSDGWRSAGCRSAGCRSAGCRSDGCRSGRVPNRGPNCTHHESHEHHRSRIQRQMSRHAGIRAAGNCATRPSALISSTSEVASTAG